MSMTTLTMGLEGIGMGVIRATRGELEVKVAKGVCACVSIGTEQGAPDKVIRNQV